MNQKTKRLLAGALLSTSILSLQAYHQIPVAEAAFPSVYWQYQDPWIAAKDSNNYSEVIRLGLIIEEIFINQPVGDSDRTTMLFNVYEAMTPAYQALGNYDKAIETAYKLIPFAQAKGFTDTVIFAEKYISQLDAMTQVYALTTDTSLAPYFGAKYEPQSGAYFGRTQNSAGVFQEESAVSIYVECFQQTVQQFDYLIKPYSNGDRMVQICLNMPGEGTSMSGLLSDAGDTYIIAMLEYLNTINAPILLRVGGEMNVWENPVDPDVFKQAFQKVATLRNTYAPNVAMVFSPNNISYWGADIMDYYPGDQYVDWVGMSAYSNKYRDPSNPTNGTFADNSLYGENMFYHYGDFTSVIHTLKEIVDLFGDRKPILISESGAGYSHKDYSLNLYDFSINQLSTLFTYANMVFPQIKMLINFDDNVPSDRYNYSMSAYPDLLKSYQSVTSNNPTLLSGISQPNATTYVKADQYNGNMSTLQLASFSAPAGVNELSVAYVLNGNGIASSQSIPYTCNIDVATLATGTHNLIVKFAGENGFSQEKYYLLHKGAGSALELEEVYSTDSFGATPETFPEIQPEPETFPEIQPEPETFPEIQPEPETFPEIQPEPETFPEIQPTPEDFTPDMLPDPNTNQPVPDFGVMAECIDVTSDHWAFEFVNYAVERGLLYVENGFFYPSVSANRGTTAIALANFCGGGDSILSTDFTDAVGTRYSGGIAFCAANGIMSGMGDGTFGTENNLTREQFATTLRSMAIHLGIDVVPHTTDLFTFSDVADISSWAFSPLQWAVGEGLMVGSNNQLNPQNEVSRTEVAIMLKAFAEKYSV